MFITVIHNCKKIMKKQLKYVKCEVSRRELWECQLTFFFTVNYTMTCSFSLFIKNYIKMYIKSMYHYIYHSYLPFIVRKPSFNQLTVFHCSIFAVFYC